MTHGHTPTTLPGYLKITVNIF